MTYKQAIPIIYRRVKSEGKTIDILTLTQKIKSMADTNPYFSETKVNIIVDKILGVHNKELNT
jgi:hypothetical protein